MLVLWSLGVSGVAYYFLQSLEDARAARQHSIPASMPRRVLLWFFLWMVTLVLLYLVGVGGGSSGNSDGNGEGGVLGKMQKGAGAADPMEMLRRIPEEVEVGLPPF